MLPAVAGFGADRLVGGRIAQVAGGIQFIVLVGYFFLAAVAILFKPYQGRVGVFLGSTSVQWFLAGFCTVLGVLAVFAISRTFPFIFRAGISA